jgi:hypothetical protein
MMDFDPFFDKWAAMTVEERNTLMKRAQGARAATQDIPDLEKFLPKAPKAPRVRRTSRELRLMAEYGLTLQEWEQLFESQGRCCAICKGTEPGTKNGWHTDHCHSAKRVRAILCQHCNVMLGHAKDDIERLQAAILYLKKHAPWRYMVTC